MGVWLHVVLFSCQSFCADLQMVSPLHYREVLSLPNTSMEKNTNTFLILPPGFSAPAAANLAQVGCTRAALSQLSARAEGKVAPSRA